AASTVAGPSSGRRLTTAAPATPGTPPRRWARRHETAPRRAAVRADRWRAERYATRAGAGSPGRVRGLPPGGGRAPAAQAADAHAGRCRRARRADRAAAVPAAGRGGGTARAPGGPGPPAGGAPTPSCLVTGGG